MDTLSDQAKLPPNIHRTRLDVGRVLLPPLEGADDASGRALSRHSRGLWITQRHCGAPSAPVHLKAITRTDLSLSRVVRVSDNLKSALRENPLAHESGNSE